MNDPKLVNHNLFKYYTNKSKHSWNPKNIFITICNKANLGKKSSSFRCCLDRWPKKKKYDKTLALISITIMISSLQWMHMFAMSKIKKN